MIINRLLKGFIRTVKEKQASPSLAKRVLQFPKMSRNAKLNDLDEA